MTLARNITPDKETGIGTWTVDDFKKTLRTGINPKGEVLLPPMPIPTLQNATEEDLEAIYHYLMTVKPIHNAVAQQGGRTERVRNPRETRWKPGRSSPLSAAASCGEAHGREACGRALAAGRPTSSTCRWSSWSPPVRRTTRWRRRRPSLPPEPVGGPPPARTRSR